MGQNRRRHYRVTYPEMERARFSFGTSISEVLECSEQGLRFRTAGPELKIGTRVNGRLALRHGKEIRVSGTVMRSDPEEIALNLDRAPIPFLAVMREQLYLRQAARDTV